MKSDNEIGKIFLLRYDMFQADSAKEGYMYDSILIPVFTMSFFSPFFGNKRLILHFFSFFQKYELLLLLYYAE